MLCWQINNGKDCLKMARFIANKKGKIFKKWRDHVQIWILKGYKYLLGT